MRIARRRFTALVACLLAVCAMTAPFSRVTKTRGQPTNALSVTAAVSPGSPSLTAGGGWDIGYDVVVRNDAGFDQDTNTAFTLYFGSLVNVMSTAVTGPDANSSWTGSGNVYLSNTIVTVSANSQITYHVTVHVLAGFIANRSCPAQPGATNGGFNASAELTLNLSTAWVCADVPANFTNQVDLAHVVDNGDGTINVPFLMTVTNDSTQQLVYQLDSSLVTGAGVTTTAPLPPSGPAGGNAGWNGTSDQVAAQSVEIPAGQRHTWTLGARVQVAAGSGTQAICGQNAGGVATAGSLTLGGTAFTADACYSPLLLDVTKKFSSGYPRRNPDGSFQVEYDVEIQNSGGAGVYDLTDAFKFPGGFTVSSPSATGPVPASPSWNGTTDVVVAKAVGIAQGASHTWHVVATGSGATVSGRTGLACDPAGVQPGGLLNSATVTAIGTSREVHACASLPDIAVTKTVSAGSPKPNGDGSYTIDYDITVTNSGQVDGGYDLTDALGFGAGITVSGLTATGPVTPNASWNGTTDTSLGSGVVIAAGGTQTWHITGDVAAPPGTEPTSLVCNPDGTTAGGLLNTASAHWLGLETSAHACGSLPIVKITKTVTDGYPKANGDGTYTIAYDVTVDNSGAATTYDLTDQLKFGQGIDGTARATLSGPVPTNPDWDGTTTTSVATGVAIGPGDHHVWHGTGTVKLLPGTEASAMVCAPDGTTPGGLLNEAIVTANGATATASACANLPFVEVTKSVSAESPVINDDGTYTVTYEIDVRNTGGAATTYDLSDDLRFGTGITPSVTNVTAPAGVTANPAWNGTTTTSLANGVPIEGGGGQTHRWVLTITAAVPAGTGTGPLTCSSDGSTAGGLLNHATATTNAIPSQAHACTGLPSLTITHVVGTGTPKPNGDGTYTIDYDVVVTNTGGGRGQYSLTEGFDFGAGLTSTAAEVTGPATPSASWNGTTDTTLISDLAIAPGGTHTWHITAKVTPAPDVTPAALVCAPDGTTAGGLLAIADLLVGKTETTAHACAGLPLITITKTLNPAQPVENGDGSYTVGYDVVITNAGSEAGAYDLADEFGFGFGITATDPKVTPPTGVTANPSWNGTTTTGLATGVALAADGSHTWHITARAVVGPGLTHATMTCGANGSTTDGLLNTATATANGVPVSAHACADLADVVITKALADGYPRFDDSGHLVVRYVLTVANSGGVAAKYDLTDAFEFGAGVTAGSPVVTPPAGATANQGWNGGTDTALATGQTIEPATTLVWSVQVPVTVAESATAAALRCPADRATQPGGLGNTAGLVVDGVTTKATACAGVPRLTLTKRADKTIAAQDVPLTYTVTVTNSGGTDYPASAPASITDDLSDVLDQATYPGNATASTGSVTVDAASRKLTWSGALAVGATATITYGVTVNPTFSGDHDLRNSVTGPAGSICPATCTVTVPITRLEVSKLADADTVAPGGKVTYTVLVQNSGSAAYTADRPATLTDDLTGVLDDATYNGDAKADSGPAPAVSDGKLTWSGPLAVGATVTITYSVTAKQPTTGDGGLTNTVTAPDGNCAKGCAVTTKVSAGAAPTTTTTTTAPGTSGNGKLPVTGTALLGIALTAGVLLLVGLVLLTVVRRRRS
ncbi:hypothetical protein UK23_31115 [Lentzea aerocolonigenes]|uniref:DUF7927 domain-containing protein n=1 Tax=Lentzea aerocolonigenes TaxID=68170 RepID=A0A0F0GL31_LENAE|nr:DUF11 domain-containing protein [Lentzea aerocolonigenes]KJK44000.1 hypothetical protein UK23_31115 [Lentzea aerocolonigenes]